MRRLLNDDLLDVPLVEDLLKLQWIDVFKDSFEARHDSVNYVAICVEYFLGVCVGHTLLVCLAIRWCDAIHLSHFLLSIECGKLFFYNI